MEKGINHRIDAALSGLLSDPRMQAVSAWDASKYQPEVQLAKILAAGSGQLPTTGQGDLGEQRLRSIFCSLQVNQHTLPPEDHRYWPLKELVLDPALLDLVEPGQPVHPQSLQKLWDSMKVAVGALGTIQRDQAARETYLENLLLLMQRYTWAVPCEDRSSCPDVSVYDFSRVTAALAAILADGEHPAAQLQAWAQDPGGCSTPLASLVSGDLSGVQDFIYTITDRGATAMLRGRSFYLQLLSDVVARFVLRQLGLPVTNLLYASGGNFYILARPQVESQLAEISNAISRVLYAHHHGELYLGLASVPLSGSDFIGAALGKKWQAVGQALQKVKQRRFATLQKLELESIFAPRGHGGNQDKECQVCGMEHPGTRVDKRSVTADSREGVRKCPPCSSYEALGDELRKANYLVLSETNPSKRLQKLELADPGSWEEVLQDFGYLAAVKEEFPKRTDQPKRVVWALRERAYPGLQADPTTAVGRRFLVNVTPRIYQTEINRLRAGGLRELPTAKDADPPIKPFHAMEAQATGLKRLGVLRMDVDDLGAIFREGLGSNTSLARVAALSFAVSLFFEGWVETLAEGRNAATRGDPDKGERLYSIYSGGDDLFFVGSWDEVVELARLIEQDFQRFTAHHPGLHASAGIALVVGKYPLAQAAEDAGVAEGQAKGTRWWDGSAWQRKNAISFLGVTLPWHKFGLGDCLPGMDDAHALMHYLVALVEAKEADRSLLRRLIHLAERREAVAQERRKTGRETGQVGQPQELWGPWQWLGFYTLSRLAQNKSKKLEDFKDELKAQDFHTLEWAGLAARWAELLKRSEKS